MFVFFKDGSGCALDLIQQWAANPNNTDETCLSLSQMNGGCVTMHIFDTAEGVSRAIEGAMCRMMAVRARGGA